MLFRRVSGWCQRMAPMLLVGCLAGCSGATRDGAPAGGRAETSDASESLGLRPYTLGSDSASAPGEVTHAAVGNGRLAVHDNTTRSVRLYDQGGRLLWSLSNRTTPDILPPQPNALSWHGDTLAVADVGGERGVWRYDPNGRLLDKVMLDVPYPVTAAQHHDGRWVVAMTGAEKALTGDPPNDTTVVVALLGKDGALRRLGCPVDSIYVESSMRGGMIGLFRGMRAVVASEGVYCTQPLSSNVRVLDAQLAPVGGIDLSRYMKPPLRDTPQSMDPTSVRRFLTGVTELRSVFVTERFVHFFLATHDTTAAGDHYQAVRCHRTRHDDCEAKESPHRVLGAITDDSLLVLLPKHQGMARVSILTYDGTRRS